MLIIWGNIVSLVACTVMVFIGFIKNKDKIIATQIVQFTLMTASNFLLGALGGVISNIISIVRNIIIAKKGCTKGIKVALILIQTVLSIGTVTLNPITWFPIIANSMFTWCIDTKNIFLFKWVIIITLVMWAVYDISHQNYVSVWFDICTIISTSVSMLKIKKEQQSV